MVTNSLFLKPFLNWAGGKRQLLPELKKRLPKNDEYDYYEPFIGAGALFFDLTPKKAVIGDANEQLVSTYKALRDNIDELIVLLKDYGDKTNANDYYRIRNLDRDKEAFNRLSSAEKAARLIYLNKACYNGLFRVNRAGEFNSPFGYPSVMNYEEQLLRAINRYFNENEIEILNTDFEETVKDVKSGSFVYFDPPYHSEDKTNFTRYHSESFDEKEQTRLRDLAIGLTKRGVQCLISNSDTAFIRKIYDSEYFEVETVRAKRPINSKSSGRGAVNEVLIKSARI
jgi:DNA adenine methylase